MENTKSTQDSEQEMADLSPKRKFVRVYTTGTSGFTMYVGVENVETIRSIYPNILVEGE